MYSTSIGIILRSDFSLTTFSTFPLPAKLARLLIADILRSYFLLVVLVPVERMFLNDCDWSYEPPPLSRKKLKVQKNADLIQKFKFVKWWKVYSKSGFVKNVRNLFRQPGIKEQFFVQMNAATHTEMMQKLLKRKNRKNGNPVYTKGFCRICSIIH